MQIIYRYQIKVFFFDYYFFYSKEYSSGLFDKILLFGTTACACCDTILWTLIEERH